MNNMSLNTKVIIFDSVILFISILIFFYLYRTIIKKDKEYISELVESNIEKGCEISKLNKEIKVLHNVIKNNNYDINKHHDSINYITDNKYALYKVDGAIYIAEGYTDDISKAKNFIKDGNKYYEVKRKGN